MINPKTTPSQLPGGRFSRLLVAAALCAVFLGLAPAAHARSVSDTDAAGDMVSLGDPSLPVPERAANDVVGTRLTHSAHRVAARIDFVELQKRSIQIVDLFVVTDERVHRHVELTAYQRRWSGGTHMTNRRSREIRCRIRHSIDYQANVIRVSFPRRCASNPRWVRFRVASFVDGPEKFFLDDALRDRPFSDDDANLAISARVYRGAAPAPS